MPKLSIIVPVFNEEKTVASVMDALAGMFPHEQIIYVNDGSRDQSLEIMKSHARPFDASQGKPQDLVLTKENGGKGSAVREGLKHAEGMYCTIQDADLEYDPAEIKTLLAYAEAHPGSVVFGSRFLKPNPNLYPLYLFGNKVLTWFLDLLFSARLTDSYTCYKLFPTEILKSLPLKARGFELEAELTCYPLKKRIPIVELPITYHPRTFEEGKKIGWKDALKGLWTMLKIRLERS